MPFPSIVSRRSEGVASAPDGAVIALWFVFTRLWVAAFAFAGAKFLPANHAPEWGSAADGILWPFLRWDAYFYLDIAKHWYPPGSASGPPVYHAAFFPLYPLAIELVSKATGDALWAAVLISHACTLGAALLIGKLAKTRDAAILFLSLPGSDFLSFPYNEGLFCLLIAAALLAIERDSLIVAGLIGALASATRSTGTVVTVAIIAAMLSRRTLSTTVRGAAGAILSLTGIAAFAMECQRLYGDPLYFSHIQSEWGRHISLIGPILAFTAFKFDPDIYLVSIVAVVAAFRIVRRAPPVWTASAWYLLLVPLATGSLKSMIRFQSANVPLIVGVAPEIRARWRKPLLIASLALLAFETFEYSAGRPRN